MRVLVAVWLTLTLLWTPYVTAQQVHCTIVAPKPPVDCSIGATLKRGFIPIECRRA
jgi:hypothetical protein